MTVVATPKHDAMHLWLYDERNRFKVLEKVAAKKGFELDKDICTSSLDIEKPIFIRESKRFIVDSIIDLCSVKHCSVNGNGRWSDNNNNNNYRLISTKSFSGKEIKIIPGRIYRRIIAQKSVN